MARIMVSVLYEQSGEMKDFEIPARMRAVDLGMKVAEIMEIEQNADPTRWWYQIEAVSIDKCLQPEETLEGAGIWDGEILMVSRRQRAELPREGYIGAGFDGEREDISPDSPVVGWKKLDVTIHGEEEASKPRTTRKFAWKRLD